jgi:hypothetical protein
VDPRAGQDVEKRKLLTLPGLELRPLGRPARSQSLYRLRYPGSSIQSEQLLNKMEVTYSVVRQISNYRRKSNLEKKMC